MSPDRLPTRAVAVGAVIATGVVLAMNHNDYVLHNTLLIGNHLPVSGTAILLLLALVGRRWTRFTQAELLLIWAMLGVAGGVGGSGLLRCLPAAMSAPAYLADSANDWRTAVLGALPPRWLVATQGDAPAIAWYMEGLPRGRDLPWGVWVPPVLVWGLFAAALGSLMAALCVLFYRPWSERERLVFPLVAIPQAITAEPEPGRGVNAFLANRRLWAGMAIPVFIHGLNGLRTSWPGLPAIPTAWDASGWFPDRPWSELDLGEAHLYFSIIGCTFLLTTELAFSFWASYVLFRLSFVVAAWLGAAGGPFWGRWYDRVAVFESGGAVLVLAVFLFWVARVWLAAWWCRLRGGRRDPVEDLLPPRVTLALLAGGAAGAVGWLCASGVQLWVAIGCVWLFASVLLVLTRIVAEGGLLFVGNRSPAADFLTGLAPAGWFSARSLGALFLLKGALMRDLKEAVMPFGMDGLRAGAAGRLPLGRVLVVLAATGAAAFGVGAYARIGTGFKYGAVNGDTWANLYAPQEFLGQLAAARRIPPALEWMEAGNARIAPANLVHLGLGAFAAGAMLWLRSRFLWWPWSPYGLVMCATYQMAMIWFPLGLGWAAKAACLTLGGASAYRRWLPFFLGLVLGEAAIAAVWAAVSLATGVAGPLLLPD